MSDCGRAGWKGRSRAFLIAILLSIVVNLPRVEAVGSVFTKTITFFLSFFVVFYVIVSLVRRPREIDFLVRILAGGGAVLGAFGDRRVAHGLQRLQPPQDGAAVPRLRRGAQLNASDVERGGRLRVYGSAQHPIALGAAFAVLLPLAIYRARAFAAAALVAGGRS